MAIDTKHPQYVLSKPLWGKCDDAFMGEDVIKKKGTTYVPKLSGQDDTQYQAYVNRGMFYGATEKTVKGLTGMLLHKKPMIKVPKAMEYIIEDATGTGLSLDGIIKEIAKEIFITGRYGALLDRDESDSKRVFIIGYKASEIFNWIDNNGFLTAVTLDNSSYEETDEKYKLGLKERIKEIEINENGVEVVTHTKDSKGVFQPSIPVPLTKKGERLDEIPFICINTVGVSLEIEKPPLLDLVNIVLAHWKNSVDLEHCRHWCAIPTPWISGMTIQPIVKPNEQNKGSVQGVFNIGGETAWLLPKDAKTGFLEFSGSGLKALENALEHKEKLIAIVGSRILENQKKAAEAAETARINKIGDSSTLATIATAVESGVKNILINIAEWEGLETNEIEVEFNKDFIDAKLDPAMVSALLNTYLSDGISLDTFLYNLNNGEILPEGVDLEIEKALIDSQIAKKGLGSEEGFTTGGEE